MIGLPSRNCLPVLAAIFSAGCISVPRIEADFRGIDNVPRDLAVSSLYQPTNSLLRRQPGQLPPAYRVGPNDEMTVFVMGRDELGSQIPVNAAGAFGRLRATIVQENGEIVLPLLGPVDVNGLSVEQIRTLIEDSYASRIASSNVDIIMQSCRSQPVHVTGAVNVPGTYYLCNDLRTLNDVLSEAQWLSAAAFPAGGVLTRRGQTYQLSYPLHDEQVRDLDILLEPGDSIYFPTVDDGVLPKVHVFGEVRTQGTFPVPADGLTLLDALGLAEGPITDTAAVKEIYLMRVAQAETPVTYRISLAELFQGPPVPLAADDRIYVAPRSISRWDSWWRQAIPITISARAVGN